MHKLLRTVFAIVFALAASTAFAADVQPSKNAGPYVPSPQSVVSDMLKLADVGPEDFVIDLGSGDGRIVLTAAKVFGARGFESKSRRIWSSFRTRRRRKKGSPTG